MARAQFGERAHIFLLRRTAPIIAYAEETGIECGRGNVMCLENIAPRDDFPTRHIPSVMCPLLEIVGITLRDAEQLCDRVGFEFDALSLSRVDDGSSRVFLFQGTNFGKREQPLGVIPIV